LAATLSTSGYSVVAWPSIKRAPASSVQTKKLVSLLVFVSYLLFISLLLVTLPASRQIGCGRQLYTTKAEMVSARADLTLVECTPLRPRGGHDRRGACEAATALA
jgi:hypothetical protein